MNEAQQSELIDLQHTLERVTAPWVAELGLRVIRAGPGEVVLSLPVVARLVHSGGVLSGQAMMAAADTAMILAIASKMGGFKPMTTVQLQTSFLRPVAGDSGEVQVVARVLRLGKNLVFGEIQILSIKGELAAHATTTYALI
jgi:uncharacterized protein (TIGR00369 family)